MNLSNNHMPTNAQRECGSLGLRPVQTFVIRRGSVCAFLCRMSGAHAACGRIQKRKASCLTCKRICPPARLPIAMGATAGSSSHELLCHQVSRVNCYFVSKHTSNFTAQSFNQVLHFKRFKITLFYREAREHYSIKSVKL